MAVRETVTIEVEVEGDGMKRLAGDARKLKTSLSGVEKSSSKAGTSLAEGAELAEKMRSALGPLGDVLGDVTGGFDDTVTAVQAFGAVNAAVAAAVLVTVASFVKFAGAIAETVLTIDEMSEALRERGDPALNEAVTQVERLNAKLTELGVTYDAQWVIITSKFAPSLSGLAGVAEMVLPYLGRVVDKGLDLAAVYTQAGQTIQNVGRALAIVDMVMSLDTATADLSQSMTDLDENFVSLVDEFGQFGQSEELPGFISATSDATDDLKEALAATAVKAREARQALSGFGKEAKATTAATQELPSKFLDTTMALEETTEASSIGGDAFNQLAREATQATEVSKKSLQEMAQEAEASTTPYLSAVSGVVSTISDLYNQATENQIANMKEGSAEQRKALKKQFAANKAFSIVQATINTAMAVMQALSSMPPPASIVFAALAAATGAAQIAIIAAQKPPSFHRGGLLPDEQPSFGGQAITRQNEAGVVFTAQGQRSFTDAINAMNRGEGSRGGSTTIMLDSQPIRGVVYQMGQADPAYGHRRRH